jgi:uncharacterized linocin/CFP29 family protein
MYHKEKHETMKIKIKDKKVSLPNAWKQCGLSLKEWEELQNGKTVEVTSITEAIKNLVDVEESISKPKPKTQGGK